MCEQRDNAVLRQHVLDLRRAVRAVGCDLNASATFFPLPVRGANRGTRDENWAQVQGEVRGD